MADWKKIVVSGSNISELNNDAGFLVSAGSGIVSGSDQVSDFTVGGDLTGTIGNATVAQIQNVAITADEATQLSNIDTAVIDNSKWVYLSNLDQDLITTSDVTFNSINTTTDLTVGGNLFVNGDLTNINVANLNVEDQFILLASGSAGMLDAGVIFGGVGGVAGKGFAVYYDIDEERLSVASSIAYNATSATAEAYIPLVFDVDNQLHTPEDNPGNIKIEGLAAFIYV